MILSNKVVFLGVDQIFRISRHILLSFSTKVNYSRVSFIKGIRVRILYYSIRMLNICYVMLLKHISVRLFSEMGNIEFK